MKLVLKHHCLAILTIVGCFAQIGCTRVQTININANEFNPLGKRGEITIGHEKVKYFPEWAFDSSTEYWVVWREGYKKYDSRRLDEIIHSYWFKAITGRSGFYAGGPAMNDVFEPDYSSSGRKAHYIICIDPMVLLASHDAINRYPDTSFVPGDARYNFKLVGHPEFIYGRRVPYDADAMWWSPDLDALPQPAIVISEDQRMISVPWGSIMLTRQGDHWLANGLPK